MKEDLFGKTLSELAELLRTINLPKYTSRQIAEWMYKKNTRSFEGMTNISKENRKLLSENFSLIENPPVKVQQSSDGTKKYLFKTPNNLYIEAAFIPEAKRNTLCISSQIGCMRGCLFCMTARQGFQGNLTSGEILNQLFSIPEKDSITNIVYMGMGEPFDNLHQVLNSIDILTSDYGPGLSPKRITVSTIGVIPGMKRFIEQSASHLAISLHSPFEDERKNIMPVEKAYPIHEVINVLKEFPFERQRRISIEYIMFKGINDTARHINGLASLLNGIRCRVNLIRFHKIPGVDLESSSDETISNFKDALNKKGILTTIRASRGTDIDAACGLLSTKNLVKK